MYNFVTVEEWREYIFNPTNDTVSEDPGTFDYDGTGYDMCGTRLYTIESLTGGGVVHSKVDELDIFPGLEFRALTMIDWGAQIVFLNTQLADYPHIEQRQQFIVTFYALLETLAITQKYHQIGGKELEIVFQEFSILPLPEYDWDIVYELQIEDNSGSYINTEDDKYSSWITFTPEEQYIMIKTSNPSHKGFQNLRIKATVLDEPLVVGGEREELSGLETFSNFIVEIDEIPPPVSVGTPPYFQEVILEDVALHYSENWQYTLPDAIDDESDLISYELIVAPEFVLWDQKKTTFDIGLLQTLTNDDAGTYTISFELADSAGAVSDPYTI